MWTKSRETLVAAGSVLSNSGARPARGRREITHAFDTMVRRVTSRFADSWVVWGSHEDTENRSISGSLTERFSPYRPSRNMTHRSVELCLCFDGTMCVRLDGANLRIGAGDVVLIPAEAPHEELGVHGEYYACIWATADPYMAYMHISGKDASTGFYSREAISVGPDTGFDVSVGELARLIESPSRRRTVLMKSHLLQFMVGVLDAIDATDPTDDELPIDNHPSLAVVKVLNFIKRNHTRKIRLADIADEVCVSPGHLNALFKKERGQTVMQALEAHRISVAKKLLAYTENSVEEIADHLAFCDQFHFSKTFKKRTGLSPVQFRRH